MGYQSAIREVLREYETDRERAAAELARRQADVYARLPRVRAIDEALRVLGLSLAQCALSGDKDALAQAKTQAQALRAEKAALYTAHGLTDDYFTPPYRCTACGDTGYTETADGKTARCRCLQQRLIDKYYDLSNLRGILAEENFDTFDLRYYSDQVLPDEGLSPYANMQTIYQTAMRFVLDFNGHFQNLLFYGETGLGKTFLCNCVAKDLLDLGHTVLYVTAPRLFKLIEDYRFNRAAVAEPDETLEAVTEVDLLLLDDLGAEFSTVVTSAALFDIVNQRLLGKKSTVISTNLSPLGLEAQYSERIVSRFLGHYKMMKFFGEDIRVKKKYAART